MAHERCEPGSRATFPRSATCLPADGPSETRQNSEGLVFVKGTACDALFTAANMCQLGADQAAAKSWHLAAGSAHEGTCQFLRVMAAAEKPIPHTTTFWMVSAGSFGNFPGHESAGMESLGCVLKTNICLSTLGDVFNRCNATEMLLNANFYLKTSDSGQHGPALQCAHELARGVQAGGLSGL